GGQGGGAARRSARRGPGACRGTHRLVPRPFVARQVPAIGRFRGRVAAPSDRETLQAPVARALLEGRGTQTVELASPRRRENECLESDARARRQRTLPGTQPLLFDRAGAFRGR